MPQKKTPPQKAAPAPAKRQKSSTERIFGPAVMSHGFTGVPNILVRGQKRLGLNTAQFNILVQLLSYWMDPAKPPFPSKRKLLERLEMSETTLQKHIRDLEKQGFLEREQQTTAAGDFGSNIYHLDGLVRKLKKLAPDFDDERAEREAAREKTERPNARANARAAAARQRPTAAKTED